MQLLDKTLSHLWFHHLLDFLNEFSNGQIRSGDCLRPSPWAGGGGKLPLPHTQTHTEKCCKRRDYIISKLPQCLNNETAEGNTHQVLGGDGLAGATCPHHHAGQPAPHVVQAVGQSQDGHDLAGHRNVEASLERTKWEKTKTRRGERRRKKKKNYTQYKPQGQQMKLALGRGPLQLVHSLAGHEINKPRFRRFMVVIVWNCVRVCSRDGRKDNPRLVDCEIEFCNCEWERRPTHQRAGPRHRTGIVKYWKGRPVRRQWK